jgi:hypothetical protein
MSRLLELAQPEHGFRWGLLPRARLSAPEGSPKSAGCARKPWKATFLGVPMLWASTHRYLFKQHCKAKQVNYTDMSRSGEDVQLSLCRLCLCDIEVAYLDVSSIRFLVHAVESRPHQHQAEDVGDEPTTTCSRVLLLSIAPILAHNDHGSK